MKIETKYYANKSRLELICRELKIVKSKWDSAMEKMPIKGLAGKYFSLMSTGQKNFSIEIYQELARNFTKMYKDKGIQKEVSYKDLFIYSDKDSSTKNEKDRVVYLEKYEQYGAVYGDVNPKLIYNHVRVNSDIASLIEYFTKSMNSTHERQEKYKNVLSETSNQQILSTLTMLAPFNKIDKQAILESPNIHERINTINSILDLNTFQVVSNDGPNQLN